MLDVRFSADYVRFSPKSGRIDTVTVESARDEVDGDLSECPDRAPEMQTPIRQTAPGKFQRPSVFQRNAYKKRGF